MSINLHAAVRSAIQAVNTDVLGTWRKALPGYTMAPGAKRVPSYQDIPGTPMQVQALDAKEVQHLDSLNIVGVMRGFWIAGDVQAGNRSKGVGGDLLVLPSGDTYLVVHVFETWDGSGWCHVAGALQMD